MKHKLVIWGSMDIARSLAEVVMQQDQYELVGFLDDVHASRWGGQVCGLPILGGQEKLDQLHRDGVRHVLLGFANCMGRLKLGQLVRERGFELATAIHPEAVIAEDVHIGPGTSIFPRVIIRPDVHIGSNVMITSMALITHNCIIGDGVFIGPGACLAGYVKVGRGAWIGMRVTVSDRLSVGSHSVIGIGSVVLKDVPDSVVAYGVPARIGRKAMMGATPF